jgi:urease accessory protein
LVQDLSVRRANQLVYRDRFDWQGPWDQVRREWHVGKHLASGSLFVSGSVGPLPECSPGVERTVLTLSSGDTCIRLGGVPPEVVWECARLALGLAACWSGGEVSSPWLIGANNLAPNHWFSKPPVH